MLLFLYFTSPAPPKQTNKEAFISLYIYPRQWIQPGNLEYICVIGSSCWAHDLGPPHLESGFPDVHLIIMGCGVLGYREQRGGMGLTALMVVRRSSENYGLPTFWATPSFLNLHGRLWLRVGYPPVHLLMLLFGEMFAIL